MTQEEFRKKLKWTKNFCIVIGVINALGLFMTISASNVTSAILEIVILVFLYLFYTLTAEGKIAGPILGIILATLYILQFSIVGIILGICILVDCIAMLKYIKESKQ